MQHIRCNGGPFGCLGCGCPWTRRYRRIPGDTAASLAESLAASSNPQPGGPSLLLGLQVATRRLWGGGTGPCLSGSSGCIQGQLRSIARSQVDKPAVQVVRTSFGIATPAGCRTQRSRSIGALFHNPAATSGLATIVGFPGPLGFRRGRPAAAGSPRCRRSAVGSHGRLGTHRVGCPRCRSRGSPATRRLLTVRLEPSGTGPDLAPTAPLRTHWPAELGAAIWRRPVERGLYRRCARRGPPLRIHVPGARRLCSPCPVCGLRSEPVSRPVESNGGGCALLRRSRVGCRRGSRGTGRRACWCCCSPPW